MVNDFLPLVLAFIAILAVIRGVDLFRWFVGS